MPQSLANLILLKNDLVILSDKGRAIPISQPNIACVRNRPHKLPPHTHTHTHTYFKDEAVEKTWSAIGSNRFSRFSFTVREKPSRFQGISLGAHRFGSALLDKVGFVKGLSEIKNGS